MSGMLTDDILARYHMIPLAGYKERFGDNIDTEIGFYQTFLIQTDYIPLKMMEAQLTGEMLTEDYSAVLQYRKLARGEINRLQAEIEADNNASLKGSDSNGQEA